MMPAPCASMRSMARCVLPVLVGPRMAVTPRARRDGGSIEPGALSKVISLFEGPGQERPGTVPLRAGIWAIWAAALTPGTPVERKASESRRRGFANVLLTLQP